MFGWLTRNDGRRGAKAARRLASPRGAVFSEFALVMPIVMLVCSALIEIVGYWDAQIMANHAAWTVGRIAMVRGSDGLPFWDGMNEKSKTGVTNTNMPPSIQKFLEDLTRDLRAANQFNNRGNIATLFLMSSCGLGYFGGRPKDDLTGLFNTLIDDGVTALVDGVPELITDALTDFNLPDIFPGGGTAGLIEALKEKINEFLKELLKKLFEPLLGKIAEWLKEILGKLAEHLDNVISGDRFARQLYGGASRIVRAKDTTGREVLVVTDMEKPQSKSNPYVFAKAYDRRLVYPQIADEEVKSDGYFVTGAHGWPPNYADFAMTQIEINWPYEYGWLFPVVSGGSGTSNAPVATGHSMVFPQPSIVKDNLYSEGATAYPTGEITNNPSAALDKLSKEMNQYLKFVRFCMQYRICEESIHLDSDNGPWSGALTRWKFIPELKELWPFKEENKSSYKDEDGQNKDYRLCWTNVTARHAQNARKVDIEDYFEPSSYHSKEYFYWNDATPGEGEAHKRYGPSLVSANGNAGLTAWYASGHYIGLRHDGSGEDMFINDKNLFKTVWKKCKANAWLSKEEQKFLDKNFDLLYKNIVAFAKQNKVNVQNIVQWHEGQIPKQWLADDKKVQKEAEDAESSFQRIKDLLHGEIDEINRILDGSGSYTGNPDDPVIDPDSQAVIDDPDKAAEEARKKWEKLKTELRGKLKEVDAAASDLRGKWAKYKDAVVQFEAARAKCPTEYFMEAFLLTVAMKQQKTVPSGSSFKIPREAMPYDIGAGTKNMLDILAKYKEALSTAYKREAEYGAMLGLERGKQAQEEGKEPWEIVDEGGKPDPDKPGTLAAGSDEGDLIGYQKERGSYHDHQTYHAEEGVWKWDD